MDAETKSRLSRALLHLLDNMGGLLQKESIIWIELQSTFRGNITEAECHEMLNAMEQRNKYVVSHRDEFEILKWKITDEGQARLKQAK